MPATASEPSLRASLIIPMFNGKGYIDACLQAVLHQTVSLQEYEIIVVDDASTDGGGAYIRAAYPQVQVVTLERNQGFANAANVGAKMARGGWTIFLNMDTRAAPDWLERLLDAAESDADVGGVAGTQRFPWRDPERRYLLDICRWGFVRYYPVDAGAPPRPILFLSGANCAVRTAWIRENWPPFAPEFYSYSDDRDLSLRLAAQGCSLLGVPGAVVWHDHPNPVRNVDVGWQKGRWAARNGWRAYLRNMYLTEFLPFVPFVLIGSFLRAWEFPAPFGRRLAAGGGFFLLTLAYLPAASWYYLVRHPEERREILRRRTRPRGWLFRQLIRRPAQRAR